MKVLYQPQGNLAMRWVELRWLCDMALAYGNRICCYKSAVVGDYCTLENR